jgi:hypothetical protein
LDLPLTQFVQSLNSNGSFANCCKISSLAKLDELDLGSVKEYDGNSAIDISCKSDFMASDHQIKIIVD